MISIADTIKSLLPDAEFSVVGDEYAGIQWLSENLQVPTEQEIASERARLQTAYDVKDYQRKRAAEYPSTADQFDLLYHGGYDAWKAAIDAVKTKYPKG